MEDLGNELDEQEHFIKLLVIGDHKVGKKSFIKRFLENKFSNEPIDIKELEKKSKNLEVENQKINVQIWNGIKNKFKKKITTKEFYIRIQGIIIIFDLTKFTSFQNLNYYVNEIKNKCGTDMPILIIGNKSDLDSIVSENDIKKFSTDNSVTIINASAKEGINVMKSIEEIIKIIITSSYYRGDTITIENKNAFTPRKKYC